MKHELGDWRAQGPRREQEPGESELRRKGARWGPRVAMSGSGRGPAPPDPLQQLGPGPAPEWLTDGTLGKFLPPSRAQFPQMQKEQNGYMCSLGPTLRNSSSGRMSGTPGRMSGTPSVCAARARGTGLSSSLFSLNPRSTPAHVFSFLVIIEPPPHCFRLCGKP